MNTAIMQLLSLLGIMQGIVILLTSAPSEALEVILYSFYFLLLAEGVEKIAQRFLQLCWQLEMSLFFK